jgi:hypothetical protein
MSGRVSYASTPHVPSLRAEGQLDLYLHPVGSLRSAHTSECFLRYFFLGFLTFEDETVRLSRNAGIE